MAKPRHYEVEELPYFEHPETHDQLIFNYQKEYKDGKKNALGKIYEVLTVAGIRFCTRLNKKDKSLNLSVDDIEIKARDAASYIIEQYLKRDDFVMGKSPTGYLFLRCLQECKYKSKRQRMVKYTDELPEDSGESVKMFVSVNEKTHETTTFNTLDEMLEAHNLSRRKFGNIVKQGGIYEDYKFECIEL